MGYPYRFVHPIFLSSIHSFNPDIIHCLCYRHFTTDLSLIYAKLLKIPIVISIHGLGHYPTSLFKKILWLYDNTIGRIMLGLVDRIIAYPFSDGLEDPLKKFGYKTVFINPAIDFSKFVENKDNIEYNFDEDFILLSIGRETANDYKGQKFLVEAFSRMKMPNCKLLIVGTNKGSDVEKNIYHLGYVEPEALGELYRSADVFVQTSKFESCSRVVCEALGFRLPIISTPVGIAPYIVDENVGFLIDYGNFQEFKKAVTKLYMGTFKINYGDEYREMFETFKCGKG